jgi:hypothetical protein
MTQPNKPDVWADFRRRRRWHYGVLFGGVIAVPLISAFIEEFTGSEAAYHVGLAFWLAATLVTEVWLSLVKCPRCGRPFFRSFWFQHLLLYELPEPIAADPSVCPGVGRFAAPSCHRCSVSCGCGSAWRSPGMRAERAKLKSRRDAMIIAQGKRSAALGCGPKMISSFFPSGLASLRPAKPEGKKEAGWAGLLPRAAASAALPWAIIRPPLRGSGMANLY